MRYCGNTASRPLSLQHLREAPRPPTLLPVTVAQLPGAGPGTPAARALPIIEIELAGAFVPVPEAVDERPLRIVPRARHV